MPVYNRIISFLMCFNFTLLSYLLKQNVKQICSKLLKMNIYYIIYKIIYI